MSMTLKYALISIEEVQIPKFLPTRELISSEKIGELKNSIKKHGLKYAIRVRTAKQGYELIDGFLRLKAMRELGWREVPAEITETTDENVVVDSLITNKDRMDEDPITVAKKLDVLVNQFGWTQERVSEELGMSRQWVSNAVRLLKLPKEIIHCLSTSDVSAQHGILLLELEDPSLQIQLANEVVEYHLSTTELQQKIWHFKSMPHLQATALAPTKEELDKSEKVARQHRTLCVDPRCLRTFPDDEIDHVDGKAYCRSHFPEAKVAFENQQKRLERATETKKKPASPKELDTWENRKANMSPQHSKMEETIIQALAARGIHNIVQDREFCVMTTTPDIYLPQSKLVVYLDFSETHKNRLDEDEKLRDLLILRHGPNSKVKDVYKVLSVPYASNSKGEVDGILAKILAEIGTDVEKDEATLLGASGDKEGSS